jgi:hypothetical protein
MAHKSKNQVILDIDSEFKIKAIAKRVGTFSVIAIDWEHPNYGYFTDAMLWYKSMHMSKWNMIPIVNWADDYLKKEDDKYIGLLEEFLKDYPELKTLFEMEIWTDLFFYSGLKVIFKIMRNITRKC